MGIGHWAWGIGHWERAGRSSLILNFELISPLSPLSPSSPPAPPAPSSPSSLPLLLKWKKRCEETSQRFFQEGIIISRP
ncbi:hypothetical protein [Nostoc favosum]|uniref:Uncharacterized protein n=1 Tax=Nostoc favosum CHAB5714 TaxID=2780399 RepID=A0ABS8IKL8_9NOSO|nr:hypothetical protein [Nostoc favosum]MCC5604350.1 hypothetical protein [Nostoc favosum CHAB5714]